MPPNFPVVLFFRSRRSFDLGRELKLLTENETSSENFENSGYRACGLLNTSRFLLAVEFVGSGFKIKRQSRSCFPRAEVFATEFFPSTQKTSTQVPCDGILYRSERELNANGRRMYGKLFLFVKLK